MEVHGERGELAGDARERMGLARRCVMSTPGRLASAPNLARADAGEKEWRMWSPRLEKDCFPVLNHSNFLLRVHDFRFVKEVGRLTDPFDRVDYAELHSTTSRYEGTGSLVTFVVWMERPTSQ